MEREEKIAVNIGEHTIELTWQEMRAVCDYMNMNYLKEDIRTRISEEEIPNANELHEHMDKLADYAKRYIERNDYFWDNYWSNIDESIKEFSKTLENK